MMTASFFVTLAVLAFMPAWFFLLPAYRHCKKYQQPVWPYLAKIVAWPGWGLGQLYANVPVKPPLQALAIYKRFFVIGSVLSCAFIIGGLVFLWV
jgi:hypothetical protein